MREKKERDTRDTEEKKEKDTRDRGSAEQRERKERACNGRKKGLGGGLTKGAAWGHAPLAVMQGQGRARDGEGGRVRDEEGRRKGEPEA